MKYQCALDHKKNGEVQLLHPSCVADVRVVLLITLYQDVNVITELKNALSNDI